MPLALSPLDRYDVQYHYGPRHGGRGVKHSLESQARVVVVKHGVDAPSKSGKHCKSGSTVASDVHVAAARPSRRGPQVSLA